MMGVSTQSKAILTLSVPGTPAHPLHLVKCSLVFTQHRSHLSFVVLKYMDSLF